MSKKNNGFKRKSVKVQFIENVTDFSKFKFLNNLNRKVDEAQVQALMDSFNKFGADGAMVIVIRSRAFGDSYALYMADGQHTVIAATRLGIGIDVKVITLLDDTPLNVTKYIAVLNNTSKSWSTNNYLKSFASNGIREYQKLDRIKTKYGLTITDLLYIYLGGGGSKENKMYKGGELKFINEDDSDKLLEAVVKVKELVPNKAYVRRSLYKLMRMSKNYNRFAKAIIETKKGLDIACASFPENEQDFYNHLLRVYQNEFKV